jgi:Fe-S-cluster containining protein
MSITRIVPCDGCTACCRNELVILHPEDGDVISTYRTHPIRHPMTGALAFALDHKPNGDCVYLGESGCTIHNRAPAVCRSFDCRRLYSLLTSKQRREQSKDPIMKTRLDAGKKRLGTL